MLTGRTPMSGIAIALESNTVKDYVYLGNLESAIIKRKSLRSIINDPLVSYKATILNMTSLDSKDYLKLITGHRKLNNLTNTHFADDH